ncbi:MAG TPA: restriction endonuclease subunit S [Agitococcus sp.]|nr:restriction endonuclease subunit S [Agitococcus sp.]
MSFEFQLPAGWEWSNIDTLKAEGRSIVSGPFGSNIGSRFFVEAGVPVIRGNNLSLDAIRFKDTGFVFLSDEKAEEFRNCEAHVNDLVFTAAGTIGQVGIIPPNARFPKYIISNKQLRARLDTRRIRPIFAYYWLSSPAMIQFIQSRNTGSTIPLINLTVLKSLPIPVPPLLIQDAIVQTIEPLDNRISLLRETNTILEAIAQTLFKSWFVDFDPVKAKAQGKQPEGMDEATAALFPSEFEESALGLIPKGWRVEKFGNVIDKYIDNRGKTPPLVKNGIPLIEIKHLLENDICPSIDTDKQVSQETFDTWFRAHPQKNDILISTVGTIGRLSLMGNEQLAIAQNILGLRVGSVIEPEYFYYLMKDSRFISDVDARLVITVQASIKRKDLETIDLLVPPKDVQQAFTYLVSSLVDKQIENQQKSRTLANLRDTLLPRLISGQLRINQAQDLINEVGA